MKKFLTIITILIICIIPLSVNATQTTFNIGDTYTDGNITIMLENMYTYQSNYYYLSKDGTYKSKPQTSVLYTFKITTNDDIYLDDLGNFTYEVSDQKYYKKANKLSKPYGSLDYGCMWNWTTKVDITDNYKITAIIYNNEELGISNIRFVLPKY